MRMIIGFGFASFKFLPSQKQIFQRNNLFKNIMTNFTSKTPPDRFNVPLVHKICELYKLFHNCLKLFPKQEKYTLGQKIENIILEILELTLSASFTNLYKKETLRKANTKTDLLKYLIRIAYETDSIKMRKYLMLEEMVINIGKMLGGWQRSIK